MKRKLKAADRVSSSQIVVMGLSMSNLLIYPARKVGFAVSESLMHFGGRETGNMRGEKTYIYI